MRTRQIPGEVPDVGYDGRASPHAIAGPMGEPPTGRDEQIGQMFRNMRSAMGVSRETIARRLATSPSTIDNFEAGAIAALPHWKETARIVRSYCELLRMAPEPILRRIHDRLLVIASQPRSADPPPPRVLRSVRTVRTEPPAPEAEPTRVRPTRRRRARTLFALSAPIALVAGCGNFGASDAGPGIPRRWMCSPARSKPPHAPASTTSCFSRRPVAMG